MSKPEQNYIPTLSDVLHLADTLLDYRDRCKITTRLAQIMLRIDPEHAMFYVELPSDANELAEPVLWRIADWNTNYTTYKNKKELNELERKVDQMFSECRDKLAKKFGIMTGIEDMDILKAGAAKLIKLRDPVIATKFGLDFTELFDADTKLKQWKEKHEHNKRNNTNTNTNTNEETTD